ncbi:MAG TPA: hypothetical protein VD947_01875 [Patescibacteria group bacterium]|nr:hypothetical protein [Patescibacteria group bacterium]
MSNVESQGWCSPEIYHATKDDRLTATDLLGVQIDMKGLYNLIVEYRKSARIFPVAIDEVRQQSAGVHVVNFELEVPDGSEEVIPMSTTFKDGIMPWGDAYFTPLRKLGKWPRAGYIAEAHWNGPDGMDFTVEDERTFDELAHTEREQATEQQEMPLHVIHVPFMGAHVIRRY